MYSCLDNCTLFIYFSSIDCRKEITLQPEKSAFYRYFCKTCINKAVDMHNSNTIQLSENNESKRSLWIKRATHLLVLLIIFVSPELTFCFGRTVPKISYIIPMCYIAVFYLNYYYLIDKYMFNRKQIWLYVSINIIVLLCVLIVFYYIHTIIKPHIMRPPIPINGTMPPHLIPFSSETIMQHHLIQALKILPRISVMVIMAIALSIVLRLSEKWIKWDRKEKQMKAQLQENELKNLKNQLNPHFLFNTLNNIYALIPISQEKAQKSVHELSQLLRYTLYDNNEREVPLEKDLLFVKNYISLMRLRLNSLVTLNVSINEKEGTGKTIAPLLFISLVENAFKHGVSGDKPSVINIDIHVENNTVKCHVENSYFPKKENDKSGSGIGINNLKRQLDILYANRYTFNINKDDERYITDLIIQLTI